MVLNIAENDTQDEATVTTTSLDREIENRLREHAVRFTRGRHSVASALAVSDGPKSVAELHAVIGTVVPLSSLYRTLSVFEAAGVVAPHFGKKGVTRYELAEWLRGHHHHLICVNCGAVDDVDLPQDYEARVRELVDGISSIVSFAPLNHALEIEGRCSRCA